MYTLTHHYRRGEVGIADTLQYLEAGEAGVELDDTRLVTIEGKRLLLFSCTMNFQTGDIPITEEEYLDLLRQQEARQKAQRDLSLSLSEKESQEHREATERVRRALEKVGIDLEDIRALL